MGFLFEGFTLITLLIFIAVVASLVLLNELTRRSRLASIALYGILPIVIVVLYLLKVVKTPSGESWFGIVKTYSALVGVWGFMLIRFTKLGKTKFTFYFPILILAINIIEAIIREFEVFSTYKTLTIDATNVALLGGSWNILNSIAGILLMLTLTGWMEIKISKDKSKDMVWPDQLWFWIIAYDLWNLSYCYNCISTRSMYAGLALLVSCTLCEFVFKKGVWLQHRAQTLALFGMFSLLIDYQSSELFSIVSSNKEEAWLILAIISLLFNLGVFVYEIFVITKYKKNPLKEEVFTHLKSYNDNLKVNKLNKRD